MTGKRTHVAQAYFHERLSYLLRVHHFSKGSSVTVESQKKFQEIFIFYGKKEICLLYL